MKYVIFIEGREPVQYNEMPDPHGFPCDTYVISLQFNTLLIRNMRGQWQGVEDYEMPTVPNNIRAYRLLLEM